MSGGIEPVFRASLPGILLETHIILETMALTGVPGVRQKFVRAYPDRVGARPNIDPEHNRIEGAVSDSCRCGRDRGDLQ